MPFFRLLCLFCLSLLLRNAQLIAQDAYKVGLVGFYNLENLFDTLDTPDVRDTEFTPTGSKNYNGEVYQDKLNNLSRVLSEAGTELTPDGLAMFGVAEIENRSVLEDLIAQPALKDRGYEIVHYDSPDRRGVDVGLIYNPKYYEVTESRSVPLLIYEDDDSTRIYTRDILLVGGLFDGEPVYVMVNHWPSRRGGEARSAPLRNAGALVCKNLSDSIRMAVPNAKIIIVGDLNDDPVSPSVAEVLNAKGKPNRVRKGGFYNPMWQYFRRGLGSNAYRDAWSLFDQVILSDNWLDQQQNGYYFYRAYIFNPPYMTQKTGHFKGYPFRTYAGDTYLGGYSDHFPVYVALLKKV